MCRVIYYMAFIVEGSPTLVIPFQSTQPSLKILKKIYNETLQSLKGQSIERATKGNQMRGLFNTVKYAKDRSM